MPYEPAPPPTKESLRVVTVRMPESLHTYLKREAHQLKTNINQLALAKLSADVDAAQVPRDEKRYPPEAESNGEVGMGNGE